MNYVRTLKKQHWKI